MNKKIYFAVTLLLSLIVLYVLISNNLNQNKFTFFKNFLNAKQKKIVKKYIFPYAHIYKLENLSNSHVLLYEIKRKEKLENIIFKQILKEKNLNYKNLKMKIFYGEDRLMFGAHEIHPGSAYLDYYDGNLFIATPIGILAYGKIINNEINFKQIDNNIEDFININQFIKSNGFVVKDIKLYNDKVYISYSNEVKQSCWNTSVIFADFNYEKLNFKNIFSPKECVHEYDNLDKVFVPHQAGGKIVGLDKNNILLSHGEYRSRYLAQDENSIFGKIIKININSINKYEIFSMGLRNPQGLFVSKKANFLLMTDHGPRGGDEINILNLKLNNLPNYGWPVASYGEHYGSDKMIYGEGERKVQTNFNVEELYKKYPLLKSHEKNGFIEPIKYFKKSIAISEIICLEDDKNCVASSLKGKSLYFFNLDINNDIQNFKTVNIGERIRDLVFYDNKLLIFLENTASIGVINF